jgi:hypothetical protein
MKGFTERPAFFLEFSNENIINRFKQYARRETITYTAFENDRKFMVVIDRRFEEKIF